VGQGERSLSAAKNSFALMLRALQIVAFVGILIFSIYSANVREDQKRRVKITGITPVFSHEGCFPQDKRIATLIANDEVAVRRVRYPKECMFVRVRFKSGQEGFLISGQGEWRLE
jgi:hypothetical protein